MRRVLDLLLIMGDRCLDRVGIDADGLRQVAHLAMEEPGDLVRVVSCFPVGSVIGEHIGVDLGEQPPHVVIDDVVSERRHGDLEIAEGLLCPCSRRLIVAGEVLVGVETHEHQLLQGLAGKDHRVCVASFADCPSLQLLDFVAQLRPSRIQNFLLQLLLLATEHGDFVEILGIVFKLLGQMLDLFVPLRISDALERHADLLAQLGARLLRVREILLNVVRDFANVTTERDELPIDLTYGVAVRYLARVLR